LLIAVVLMATGASAQQATQPFGRGAYRPDEPGLIKPKLVKQVRPNYPTVARNASVAGDVELEAVVLPDGKVGEVRILKSLDTRFGLDEEAVRVAKLWQFDPARKDGFPVAVIVTIVVQFKLRASAGGSPPRLGIPSGTFTASASPASAPDDSDLEFFRGVHRLQDQGVVPPKVKTPAAPPYPRVSGSATGTVELDVVVLADGTVGKVRVSRSMDKQVGLQGFDAAAMETAKRWVFEPGTKNGVAAPIAVTLQLEFRPRR
jgi:TonB family protein